MSKIWLKEVATEKYGLCIDHDTPTLFPLMNYYDAGKNIKLVEDFLIAMNAVKELVEDKDADYS